MAQSIAQHLVPGTHEVASAEQGAVCNRQFLGKNLLIGLAYPTLVEGVKRTAAEFQRRRLDKASGRMLKKVISWLR